MSSLTFIYNYTLLLSLLTLSTSPQTVTAQLCSKGCLSCLFPQRQCTACLSNMTLTIQGICISTMIGNCYKWDDRGDKCESCRYGYLMQNGICVMDYSGCMRYQDGGRSMCQECGFGMKINGRGGCQGVLNCVQYDGNDTSRCVKCAKGFIYNDGRCFYIGRQCIQWHIASGSCVACSNNYTIGTYTCINNVVQNCDIYGQDICIKCSQGFGLNYSKCVPIPHCSSLQYLNNTYHCNSLPLGCSALNNQQICITCLVNYIHTQNNTCLPFLPKNCLQLSPQGKCTKCSGRYYPRQYVCWQVSPLCGQFNQFAICGNCRDQDLRVDMRGRCQDMYCVRQGQTGCLQCIKYYKYSNQSYRCQLDDPNCIVPNLTTCNQCIQTHYPSPTICQPLPQNCTSASSNSNCLTCLPHNYLLFHRCHHLPYLVQHCLKYSMYSVEPRCQICQYGFMLRDKGCGEIMEGCGMVLSGGECVVCIAGWRKDGKGRCVGGGKECGVGWKKGNNGKCYPISNRPCLTSTTYNKSTICTSCQDSLLLSGGLCLSIELIDINCKTYNPSSPQLCLQCYQGYYLSSNRCLLPNQNCQTFSLQTGACLTCYPGYILTNNQCVIMPVIANCLKVDQRGKCSQCVSYFYYEGEKEQCLAVSKDCRMYEGGKGRCTACYGGFQLKQGACIKKCQNGYNLVQGRCVPSSGQRGQKCIKISEEGICQQCVFGFILQQGDCIFNSKTGNAGLGNCQIALNQTHCGYCTQGYYQSKGICFKVNQNCKIYQISSGTCLTCFPSYIVSQNSCLKPALGPDPYCVKYEGVYCGLCLDGYYLKNYRCEVIDKNCVKFDYSVLQCLECGEGFVALFDQCILK